FVASPVPAGGRVVVSNLGAFNISTIAAFPLVPKGVKAEPIWGKSTPYLKLPTVSSPAVAGGLLIFGDGMHQTSGATLHAIRAADGRPVWQLPLPGKLVHLEGAPAVIGRHAFTGGGAAGVLCVERDRVTLDGRELDLAAVRKLQDAKWKELLAKYEEEKRKDPDFAVPPNEDQLPKPKPAVVWQQGQGKWHVDAPVTAAGDRLLVCSAFLDREQAGDRAVFCLDARTGKTLWRTPLTYNPWGGASVQGGTAVVTGSSIGYDYASIRGAKGDVTALDLSTGAVRWRKEVPGGVPGCAALAEGLAVVTATDGRARAYDLKTGERRWTYDAKAPVFAPVAVAGDAVYLGDLRGVVHAVGLARGEPRWRLDLGADPAVKAPGMIYAGPVVHGGRLVVGTANLAGPFADKPTALVCIGQP
ncbi:MAG TPA: PQQ-binding-like beta-propeller repeat protein, partial [Gemmataceae bacterium]